MIETTCQREDELLDALGRGFLGTELEAHAAQCQSCGELHAVAGAVLDERALAVKEAAVPAAGTMWWRLQIRHRQEAAARARRSLMVGQAATLLIAAALVISLFGPELLHGLRELAATVRLSTPILLALAAWALLVPVAGWVVLRQK